MGAGSYPFDLGRGGAYVKNLKIYFDEVWSSIWSGNGIGGGDVYHVDSGATGASDSNPGTDPNKPLATIDGGINKCADNNGDVIIVHEGHSETLTVKIAADVAGVTIIGLGNGLSAPQLTINANIDGIDFTAEGVKFHNIRFNESTNARTASINVAAANAVLSHIHFDMGGTDLLTITVTAAGERPIIAGCTGIVTANGPVSFVKYEGVIDFPRFVGNTIVGSNGTDPFDSGIIDMASQAVTNPITRDNLFLGGNQVTVVIVNDGSVVGAKTGPNEYGGLAADADGPDAFANTILGKRVVKSDGDPTAAAGSPDPLFTIIGQVLITLIYGEATSAITGGTNPETALQTTTDDRPIAASTVITGDGTGTLYMISGDPADTLNGGGTIDTVLATIGANNGISSIIVDGDGIEMLNGGGAVATGGVIKWTLFFIPLEDNATVVAA